MIEVHPTPKKALSDGPQSLTPDQFDRLMQEIHVMAKVMGRSAEKQPAMA
jgi:3-deoxy-7-phosphoheptulonate synthase